jgi:hypothetical protein
VACNDKILAQFGRSWDFPPWLKPGWEYSDRASRLLPELEETFRAVYRSSPWVWKDPRTCLTLPLWRRVIGSEATVVLVSRDPDAVVTSVKRRDGIPALYTVGLWHHYVLAALAGASGLPVVCLRFEDLVAAPEAAVLSLAEDLAALGLELGGDPGAAAASLHGHLVHSDGASPVVRRLTSSVVDQLRALPRRSDAFAPPSWREPSWVRPLLVAYRGPWVVRARTGHPLRTGAAA